MKLQVITPIAGAGPDPVVEVDVGEPAPPPDSAPRA
jgi:hypothetical protein